MLYYHRDRLGSVVATTAQGGADGAWYRYDPYGNPAGSYIGSAAVAADVESELGYTGGVRLSEGLLHLEARAYWSRLRRFVQPDNVDERRYSYVGGDPANGVDPTGHMVETRGPPVTIIVGKPDGGEIVTTVPTGGGGDGGAPSSPGGGEGVPTVTPTTPGSGVADNSSANQQAANAAIPGRGPQGERAQGPGGVGGGGASGSQRRRVQPLLSQSSSPALKSFEDHLKKCGPDMRDCIYGSAAGSPGPVVAAIAGANIVRLGQLGEATIRRYLYIGEKIATRVSGRLRIPDGINLLDSTLNEVKNVQYLAYTQQLKDFATIAALKGLDFVLYVRDGATLSGPLWEKVASGEIRLIFY
jgi:RHS repeat-associated protein